MSLFSKINDVSNNSKVRRSWLTLAIFILVCIIIVPAVFVVTKVFTEWALVSGTLNDPAVMNIIWGAIGNSFSLALIVTLLDILVGIPMAWIMVRKNFKGKNFLDTLLDMPLAFPTAVLGISVVIFWGAPEGITIASLGLHISTYMMMVLLHFIFTYPYMVRSLSGILEQIEPNYETAAMTLGASRWTAVRTITLPLFRAGIVTGFVLCFARSLSETGGTYIALTMLNKQNSFFTGPTFISALKGGQVELGGVILSDVTGPMVVISVLMILLALLLLLLVKWIMKRLKLPLNRVWPAFGRKLSNGPAPKVKDIFSIVFLVLVILLPSFWIFMYLTEPIPDLDWGLIFKSMGISFGIAGVAVAFDVIFGIPIALYIARHRDSRSGNMLDNLINIPLIIPTTALGYSLALFWGMFGSGGILSYVFVILGHISFTYPLVVRNIAGAVEEVDPSYEEVALTLGTKPFQAFTKVLFPIIKNSIVAGCILAFTRSLGETGATLAISSDVLAIPIYITNLVTAGDYAVAAMCSIVLILVCFIFMLAVRALTRGKGGERRD